MGKLFLILLLLVAGVGIAGFANYQRNEALDHELQNRPLKAYAIEDLEKLANAYQGEMDGLQARLSRTGGDNTRIMDGYAPADFDGKLKAFEQFQRKNNTWRDTNRARLEHEIELEKIQKELAIRERGLDDEFTRIKRRVLTF